MVYFGFAASVVALVPTYPAGARTGVGAVDSVLALVERRDPTGLLEKVIYARLPCTRKSQPPGTKPLLPRCRPGEPTGKIVQVIMVGGGNGCSGGYRRPDEMEGVLGAFLSYKPRTYAVYRSSIHEFSQPRGSYGLLFAFERESARSLTSSLTVSPAGRVSTVVLSHCGDTPDEVWRRTKGPVLLPPRVRVGS